MHLLQSPPHGFSRLCPALRQGRRALSRRASSLFSLIQSQRGLALGGGVWREPPSKILRTIAGSKSSACTKHWRTRTPQSGGNRLRRACIAGDIKSIIATPIFTSSYIPTLSFASDDDDFCDPEMVTDCNDDDGNDEDVGVGWDEECFFHVYCNPFQTERFLSRRASSFFATNSSSSYLT